MAASNSASRHVGVSFGQIGSLSDGLGEYSSQLALQFAAAAPDLRERFNLTLHLHLPEAWHGRFGDTVRYVTRQKMHRYLHWSPVRFDIWHTLNQLSKLAPPLGSRMRLMTVHDLNQLYAEDADSIARMLKGLRQRLRRVDQIVTLTHHVEADIRQHLDWRGPVHVIPNGARDLTSAPQTAPESLLEWLQGRPFLFHISRLTASKNPQALLDLASIWPQQLFVLAGAAGHDKEALARQIAGCPLPNVHLLGQVSDAEKAWLYAHCQAFLFPSLTEGFGLPPLEAMQFGKPVFVARRTSLPEVVDQCGGYFETFEPDEMRRTIEYGLPGWQQRAAEIRTHAQKFTWERTARDYLALYLGLLGLVG